MTTRSNLASRVANRTGRSGETNFYVTLYAAFDDFLQEACLQHDFQTMTTEDSISVSANAYSASMPTSSVDGFESDVHHILSSFLRDSSSSTYNFFIKSVEWFTRRFPDRSRTGAGTGRPVFGARLGKELHWNCPANKAYTLYLQTTHLPDESLFSSGNDSTESPVSILDLALVAYGSYAIFEAVAATGEADRQLARAYGLLAIAVRSDEKEPARTMIAQQRGFFSHPDPNVMSFDEDALATGDTL